MEDVIRRGVPARLAHVGGACTVRAVRRGHLVPGLAYTYTYTYAYAYTYTHTHAHLVPGLAGSGSHSGAGQKALRLRLRGSAWGSGRQHPVPESCRPFDHGKAHVQKASLSEVLEDQEAVVDIL